MKHVVHSLEGALIGLLAQAPMILGDPMVRHFIDVHPVVAAYVPIATGIASALYRALKPKVKPKAKPAKSA